MKILLLLLMFVCLMFFYGCNNTIVITEITVDDKTIPINVYVDEFDIKSIRIKVTYSNNTSKYVNLNEELLNSTDLSKLSTPGSHIITVKYEELKCTFIIVLISKPTFKVSFNTLGYYSRYLCYSKFKSNITTKSS